MNNVTALLLTAYEKFGTVGRNEYIDCFIDESLDTDEISLSDYFDFVTENSLDDAFYPMSDFDEIMQGTDPWEIARSCFFGDFKPCDDYFYFNGYGNLSSCDEWEIKDRMKSNKEFLIWYVEQNNLIDDDEMNEIIEKCNELIRQGY